MKTLSKNQKEQKNQKEKNQKQEKELKGQPVSTVPGFPEMEMAIQHQAMVSSPEPAGKSLKRKAKALTVDQLRSFPGLETLTDAMAREIIAGLEAFAQLTFHQYTSRYGHL